MKLSIASSSRRRFCVKSCDPRSRPLVTNDGRLVVGTELLEHETAGEILDVLRTQRRDVVVVQNDKIETAVEHLLVDGDVGLDRRRAGIQVQRLARPRIRNVNQAERLNFLRLAVLENLEIFLLQTADEIAVPVDDADVLFDVVHLHFEGDFRRRGRVRFEQRVAPAFARP